MSNISLVYARAAFSLGWRFDPVFRAYARQGKVERPYTVEGACSLDGVTTFKAASALAAKVTAHVNERPCSSCGLDWCGASCGRWPTGSVDSPAALGQPL